MARPRKQGVRTASGKLKQPTRAEREAAARAREQEAMQTVLAQPHRRGNTSQLCESALGRFCLRMKLHSALYDAGNDYAGLVRRWRAAKGVPRQLARDPHGGGAGPSPATVAEWTKQLIRIETAMIRHSPPQFYAVRGLCLDDIEPDATNENYAVEGLLYLAKQTGWMDWRDAHPFASVERPPPGA